MVTLRRVSALSASVFVAFGASAGITVDVRPSSAPNAFGSPSWNGYLANSLFGLESGLNQVGDRNTDPAGYQVMTNLLYETGDVMVTSFNSWRGSADPGGAWGSGFANELGNRIHFGLHLTGDGQTQFRLNDLRFELTSSDNVLDFAGNFNGLNYSDTRTGIWWGPDRVRGTNDDVRYSSGNGTTLVDELVYVGVGNAYWPQQEGQETEQQAIDRVRDYILTNDVSIDGGYSIVGSDGRDYGNSVTLNLVPAPGAFAILGIAGFAARGRRRG